MGIGSKFIEMLGELRLAGLVGRRMSVMEIGAQQLNNSFLQANEALRRLGLLFGVDDQLVLPAARPTYTAHGGLEHLDAAAPPARYFWTWLGFKYGAIDIDGSPGAIPLDLNYDSVPPADEGKYRLVTNFGTTEHVANQLNAFKIIHDLTALNGIMIHEVPAQGLLNHGLVNYNFKFFWMLARSNNYKFIYSDYNQVLQAYSLPENIINFVAETNLGSETRTASYQTADAGIVVVLQKMTKIPFIPPLDVATGSQTDNEALRSRYWTIFTPDELTRVDSRAAEIRAAASVRRSMRVERGRRIRLQRTGRGGTTPRR
jgi:hypothetical protein